MDTTRLDNALQQGAKIIINRQQEVVGVKVGNLNKDSNKIETITYTTGENFEEAFERAGYSFNVSFGCGNFDEDEDSKERIEDNNTEFSSYEFEEQNEQDELEILYRIAEDNRDYYLNGGRERQCAKEDNFVKNLDMIMGMECAIDNLLKTGYEITLTKEASSSKNITINIKNKETTFQFVAISVYHALKILKELAEDINLNANLNL